MSDLPRFFAAMAPLLNGRCTAADVEQAIGPSPSGSVNLDFYRVLVERNLFKILRDVHAPVRALALRQDPQSWARLVRSYAAAHPPMHWDPNAFAGAFPEWLEVERKRTGEIPVLLEQLADYQWIRHRAGRCRDVGDDGFDERLFVRQYSYDVPKIAAALEEDEHADLPGRRAVVVLVYRHTRALDVRTFYPTNAGLAALARRQGVMVPPELGEFSNIDRTEIELIEHGILMPRGTP